MIIVNGLLAAARGRAPSARRLRAALVACALVAASAEARLDLVDAAWADQSQRYAPTTGTLPGLTMVNDYNSAINSVASCNAGAARPSNELSGGPSAGECWYDTATGAVAQYDGADWLTVGYIDAANDVWTPVLGGGAATTVASATTTNLCGASGASPTQSYLTISGTTPITGFGANCAVGQIKFLSFSGALTLTYNSTSLILPTAGNIPTAAGDEAIAISLGSGNWKLAYFPISGQSLMPAPGSLAAASIAGLLPSSIAGSSTTASMTISAGAAADSTTTVNIALASPASWAVSNGSAANGYQGGTTLPSSAVVHMFLCRGGSGVTTFASTSESAPSCPTGYATYFRRIFSFMTASSTTGPIPFTADEIDGGGLQAYLATPTEDVNGSTMSTSSRTLYTMNVPTAIKVEWQGTVATNNFAGNDVTLWITSPDEPDSSSTYSSASATLNEGGPTSGGSMQSVAARRRTITNTSGQIGVRSSTAAAAYGWTTGWIDNRRN